MVLFFTVFVISYLFHGLGITIGYHRLLSHRSFKAHRLLEYFFVIGGYLALEGSPITWVSTHRIHHKFSDRSGDPHSPADGWWHSFVGWMFRPTVTISQEDSQRFCPDLYKDAFYRFLHANHTQWHVAMCLVCCILFRVLIFLLFGPLAVVANLLGAALPFIGAMMVNSFGHMQSLGYRNFETGENSRNIWWVAYMSLGEGWHNNHHAIPRSARHGMNDSEFDLTWEALKIMKSLKIVSEIQLPPSK